LIACENCLIDQCKYLWIIPLYKGIPITAYPEWCKTIKELENQGKILGMHGIEHTDVNGHHFFKDSEFNNDVPIDKIKYGMNIFKQAFGHYPKYFKAPQCNCTWENIRKIESLGMIYKGVINQILHKVYHCNDTELPYYLRCEFVDIL
jgi:predicted deacetylase